MSKNTYTPSKSILPVACQYLKHEFRKIFNDVRDKKIWQKLDGSIDGFLKREGEKSFWYLVAAISCGWKLKKVFYILSNNAYRWRFLQKVPIEKLALGGMSPIIDKYVIKRFKRDPLLFSGAWRKNKKMRQEILATGLAPHKERDHFPILLYELEDGRLHVFDGMRRTLLSIISGKKEIKAWVGRLTNLKGKPLVSGDRCLFLAQTYERSKKPNKELEKSIIRMGREIIGHYRNGREVLTKRIAGWSHNPKIKKIFKKM
jgi:hypothetical protein